MNLLNSCDALKHGLRFKNLQTGNAGCAGQRASGVGMPVKKGPNAVFRAKHPANGIRAHRGAKREEPARDAFGKAHDVRADPGTDVSFFTLPAPLSCQSQRWTGSYGSI